MSVSKKKKITPRERIPDDLLRFIASRFKVLAEPMRLRILHALQEGELTVTQIIEATNASQANVSKHLGVLAKAGMVGRRREASNAYYSITDPVIFEICELVCSRMEPALRARLATL